MNDLSPRLAEEVAAVARIAAVQTILEVVCRATSMGFSAVARVTEDRWIACAVRDEVSFGLKPGGELDIASTICNEIRNSGKLVVIDQVSADEHFCNHHTPRQYGFESYISVPIRLSGGRFFGTLCALDAKPARVNTPETIGMFTLFAELIAQHLDAHERVTVTEAALASERETAQFRDQFMAVLGHDLRNPLAAIRSAADLMRMGEQPEETRELTVIIQRSVTRIAGLIDNVLDFARGRLGGGLPIHRSVETGLPTTLKHVVRELQTAWPTRQIDLKVKLSQPVSCDAARIGQMLSNLLANALTHGDVSSPVWVHARSDAERFELSVTNLGPTLPPETIERLFQPFVRGTDRRGQGLGLGLYITSEIAQAHGGKLCVSSVDGRTQFTFTMPLEKS